MGHFDSILLSEVQEDAPVPLPVVSELMDVSQVVDPAVQVEEVRGVFCKNRHFNDPRQLFCAVCGINMVQQTPVLVNGTAAAARRDRARRRSRSSSSTPTTCSAATPTPTSGCAAKRCAASRSRTSPTRSPGCTPGSSCAAGTRCSSTTSRPTARSSTRPRRPTGIRLPVGRRARAHPGHPGPDRPPHAGVQHPRAGALAPIASRRDRAHRDRPPPSRPGWHRARPARAAPPWPPTPLITRRTVRRPRPEVDAALGSDALAHRLVAPVVRLGPQLRARLRCGPPAGRRRATAGVAVGVRRPVDGSGPASTVPGCDQDDRAVDAPATTGVGRVVVAPGDQVLRLPAPRPAPPGLRSGRRWGWP